MSSRDKDRIRWHITLPHFPGCVTFTSLPIADCPIQSDCYRHNYDPFSFGRTQMFLFCFCVAISRSTPFFDFPNRLVFCCWLCRVGCCGVGCTTKPPSPLIDSLPDGMGVSTTSFTTSSSRSYVALQRERKAGGMAAWRYEERKAAVPMAILKWAITRRPLSSLLIPASSFSLSTPHRRF